MKFLTANIDRAIVMTQHDLRGFDISMGLRPDHMASPMSLYVAIVNFMSCAVYQNNANLFDGTYEEYKIICGQLFYSCDTSQKEAIKLIIVEIVKQSETMKAEVAEGKREASKYLVPLDKSNPWGRAVLAFIEVFDIKLEQRT